MLNYVSEKLINYWKNNDERRKNQSKLFSEIKRKYYYLIKDLNGNVIFENGVQTLPDGFLQKCTAIKGVTIPEGVTSIGDNAFSECSSLIYVEFPSSVTSFGDAMFIQ